MHLAELKHAAVGGDARQRELHDAIDVAAVPVIESMIDAARAVGDQFDQQFGSVAQGDFSISLPQNFRDRFAFECCVLRRRGHARAQHRAR